MSKTVSLDTKGGRKSVKRPHRSTKKRRYPLNRYSMEKVDVNTSTSAKKLKCDESFDFEVNASFRYRLINFISVFSVISEVVKCKKCIYVAQKVLILHLPLHVLQMMQLLKLTIGPNALRLSEDLDAHRISRAEMRAQEKTKEARKLRRAAQKESEDMATSLDNLLYGPGIAD
ncbi:hypothetical protein ABEB36_015576 [Hypothenemus hampei]|uniref:Uncharacterized protein n=1 Tax=Hypothenemus hampei TaxID=57062 RepID=A0ABD1DZM1_HYPHA